MQFVVVLEFAGPTSKLEYELEEQRQYAYQDDCGVDAALVASEKDKCKRQESHDRHNARHSWVFGDEVGVVLHSMGACANLQCILIEVARIFSRSHCIDIHLFKVFDCVVVCDHNGVNYFRGVFRFRHIGELDTNVRDQVGEKIKARHSHGLVAFRKTMLIKPVVAEGVEILVFEGVNSVNQTVVVEVQA